jgi:iron complex outermembrane receptor protein
MTPTFLLLRGRVFAALSLFIFIAIVSLRAEEAAVTPVYNLEPLIRVAPNVGMNGRNVSRDSIRSAKPIDLAEILSSKMAAIAPARKSPLAGDLSLRGLNRDNILISVDETKTFCACPNRMDPPAFHVSSQQIESVRVRPGPFSVDQGGTIGGTVFVRTAEAVDHLFARGYGYAGSYDYRAGGLSVGGPLSKSLSVQGGAYHQQGGIYKDGSNVPFTQLPGTNFRSGAYDDTAFSVLSGDAKAAFTMENGGVVMGNYGYQDADDVLYPGLMMDAITDSMHRGSAAVRLPASSRLATQVEASAAFSRVDHDMRDTFRTSLTNMAGAYTSRGYFMRTEAVTQYLGARLKAVKEMNQAQLRYGLDYKNRRWDADNVVGPNSNNMLPDVVTDGAGAWGVWEIQRGPWALESGARLDVSQSEAQDDISFVQNLQQTQTNKQTDVLPSVYALVSREWGQGWSGTAGLGTAAREPDGQERYLNLNRPGTGVDWVGNPDLKPVQSLEIQPGLQWSGTSADIHVNAFHAWLNNYIYLEELPLVSPAQGLSYTNIDVRLYGVSADAGWNPTGWLRLEAGAAWQEGVKVTTPERSANKVLAEIPPLRGRVSAQALFDRGSLRVDVQMQNKLRRIDADLNERPIAGWAVVNITAGTRLARHLDLNVGIDNVLDKTYAVSNSFVRDPFSNNVVVNEPGRFIYARVGVEF